MESNCCCGICTKCYAGKLVIIGAVLFIATWYAKAQRDVYFIWYALAVLVILKGLLMLVKPNCPHCEEMPMKKGKK